jgi:hypothetical protein
VNILSLSFAEEMEAKAKAKAVTAERNSGIARRRVARRRFFGAATHTGIEVFRWGIIILDPFWDLLGANLLDVAGLWAKIRES